MVALENDEEEYKSHTVKIIETPNIVSVRFATNELPFHD